MMSFMYVLPELAFYVSSSKDKKILKMQISTSEEEWRSVENF